jgi:hypothetical protein
MKSFTIKAIVLALLVSIGFCAGWYVRLQRFKAGFSRVQVGDTKEQVIKQLGQPAEIAPCFHYHDETELGRKCAEDFWYYSFMERWGVSLDANGKVIHTNYSVSP